MAEREQGASTPPAAFDPARVGPHSPPPASEDPEAADAGRVRLVQVEIAGARRLLAKDGASSSPFCVVEFNGHTKRTHTVERNLNPVWDEKFVFAVPLPSPLPPALADQEEPVHVTIYTPSSAAAPLVPIRLHAPTPGIPPLASALLTWLPLERRSLINRVRGDLRSVGHGCLLPGRARLVHRPCQPGRVRPMRGRQWHLPPSTSTSSLEDSDGMPTATSRALSRHGSRRPPAPPPLSPSATPSSSALHTIISSDDSALPSDALSPLLPPATAPRPAQQDLTFPSEHKGADSKGEGEGRGRGRGAEGGWGEEGEGVLARSTLCFSWCDGGKVTARTRTVPDDVNPKWNQVFAIGPSPSSFSLADPSSTLEIVIKNENRLLRDSFLGAVSLPSPLCRAACPPRPPLTRAGSALTTRLPPPSHRCSQRCEVQVAAWIGERSDELFGEAWQWDVKGVPHHRSRTYPSPRLWYLRVHPCKLEHFTTSRLAPNLVVRLRVPCGMQVQTGPATHRTPSLPPGASSVGGGASNRSEGWCSDEEEDGEEGGEGEEEAREGEEGSGKGRNSVAGGAHAVVAASAGRPAVTGSGTGIPGGTGSGAGTGASASPGWIPPRQRFGHRLRGTLNAPGNTGSKASSGDNPSSSISASISSAMDNLNSTVGSIGTTVGNIGTTVGNIGTTVGNIGTTVGSIGTTVGNIGTTVGNIGTTVGSIRSLGGSMRIPPVFQLRKGADGVKMGADGVKLGKEGVKRGVDGLKTGPEQAVVVGGEEGAGEGVWVWGEGEEQVLVLAEPLNGHLQVHIVNVISPTSEEVVASAAVLISSIPTRLSLDPLEPISIALQPTTTASLNVAVRSPSAEPLISHSSKPNSSPSRPTSSPKPSSTPSLFSSLSTSSPPSPPPPPRPPPPPSSPSFSL
ncbi:hypothetical protein CLOP_g23279 [Closterium sp. NIES-67]|nr:hypothetical protein CLOP_g23279 [Closterium sp. NIES-67]